MSEDIANRGCLVCRWLGLPLGQAGYREAKWRELVAEMTDDELSRASRDALEGHPITGWRLEEVRMELRKRQVSRGIRKGELVFLEGRRCDVRLLYGQREASTEIAKPGASLPEASRLDGPQVSAFDFDRYNGLRR